MAAVGIVIAAYNAESYLAETLSSVQAQSTHDWTCVIVDDGSLDSSAAIAEQFARRDPRFQVVRQPNAGVSAARNTGLRTLPPTSWLAFLDSDDTWLPDTLQVLLDVASGRPDAAGVYGLAEYMDERGRPIRPGEHPTIQRDRRRPGRMDLRSVGADEDGTFAVLVVSGTIWPPAVGLFARDIVIRAGLFDPEQRFVEDWDLYIRMSRFGPFVPVDRQVAWYRQHPEGLTRKDELMAFYYARVHWKAWNSPENTPAQRRVVRRVWLLLRSRALLWTVSALVSACRTRDRPTARAASAAIAVFAAELLRRHPGEPTTRSARYSARFIADRRGRGASNVGVTIED